MSTAELAASYAALALADDGVEITVRVSQLLRLTTPKQEEDSIWRTDTGGFLKSKRTGKRKQDSID